MSRVDSTAENIAGIAANALPKLVSDLNQVKPRADGFPELVVMKGLSSMPMTPEETAAHIVKYNFGSKIEYVE